MRLSKQEADLFYKLMGSLQFYVNQRHKILPNATTLEAYFQIGHQQRLLVRNELYADIDLIDEFVKENPRSFPPDELEIIRSWKHFLAGDFFVERLLKKFAIFIQDDNVYAVLAIMEPFEDIFTYASLPVYVRAVLLPFKEKIIYDGLLEGYSIYFGGGIRYDLKETYMKAKQNRTIIESLLPQEKRAKKPPARKSSKDWRAEIDELHSGAKKLRASAGDPAIISPAFSLVKAGLEFSHVAVSSPEDLDELWRVFKKVERAVDRVATTLYRAES